MERVRICLVDDHLMLLDGLSSLLSQHPAVEIAGMASNPLKFLDELPTIAADLLITDFSMPQLNGVQLIMEVKQRRPEIKTLLLTMHHDRSTVSEALAAESEGYILKNSGKEEIFQAIEAIAGGSTYYGKDVIKTLIKKTDGARPPSVADTRLAEELTAREKAVLTLIMNELTSEEIAGQLCISKRTVDTYRQNLLEKTQAKTVVGLIKYAVRSGLVQL